MVGKFTVVAGVAVYDIEGLHLGEMVFGSVSDEDGADARVEPASEDCSETGFLEAIAVSPLP